jgi:BirA family biotin operon repressor/biotin-[acetyl-CoA-carboxylase] ligase
VTDALTPDRVIPLLRGRFGQPYRYAERCVSTQRLFGEDDPHGTVAVCDEQTGGRGRLGRRWEAPPGTALLCSILLRPADDRNIPELSLVAAVGVAETIEETTDLEAGIKWPNDVLLADQKVAGILAEGRGQAVVLGIGLNVNQSRAQLPVRPLYPAASLLLCDGRRRDRAPLLALLLHRLELAYERWAADCLDTLLPALARRDVLRGRRVEVGGVQGTAAGITASGELVLETDGGRQQVASGEVTLR